MKTNPKASISLTRSAIGSLPTDPRLGSAPAFTRSNKKYRPSLTAEQINHILYLAKTVKILGKEEISLISTLAPFQAKIENDCIAPAYITQQPKPRVNSLESLGAGVEAIADSGATCKEDYWQLCYLAYIADPSQLSLQELEAVAEHRYINDLMSPEEEQAHETK